MNIGWVTTELAPLVKVGGLADVSGALPKALSDLDHDVRCILPYYSFISENEYEINRLDIKVELPNGEDVSICKTHIPNTELVIYLIQHIGFNTNSAYEESEQSEVSLDKRFAILSWCAANIWEHIGWNPDILHANDWPAGPAMSFVKQRKDTNKQVPKTVFSIHNLGYQGRFEDKALNEMGLNDKYIQPLKEEDEISFLRMGINHADQVSTVSQTYAQEIQTEEFGYGLEDDLKAQKREIVGVINGIDVEIWSPETDEFLVNNYSSSNLEGKIKNKLHLQKISGLDQDEDNFLLGIVSRLVYQKGINLIVECLPEILEENNNIQMVILGTGQPEIEDDLEELHEQYLDQIGLFIEYDNELSHKIYAGADVFLVPSRYEPCGLSQLYSMQYGTVPIVRKTGGLADTVGENKLQTGFVFEEFDASDLCEAILRGYNTFSKNKDQWKKIQLNGMQQDLSWNNPAKSWEKIYRNLLSS